MAVSFDPFAHHDPARALVMELRGLRVGDRVALPDGTQVHSVSVRHGSAQARRYAVVKGGGGVRPDSPVHSYAEEAAAAALGKKRT